MPRGLWKQQKEALFLHPTRGWVQFGQGYMVTGCTITSLANSTVGMRALIYQLTEWWSCQKWHLVLKKIFSFGMDTNMLFFSYNLSSQI